MEANPNSPEAYNVRGTAYGRAGRNREALADFTRAIELNPRFYPGLCKPRTDPPRHRRSRALRSRITPRAFKINSQYDAAYIGRGNVYRFTGNSRQALRDYERAIQLGSTNPRAYHSRGLIYQGNGQHDRAIEDFTTAISLDPTAAEPYNSRGVSYLAINDSFNALEDANRALRLNDRLAEAWVTQGLALEAKGDKRKGQQGLQTRCPTRQLSAVRKRWRGAYAINPELP